MILGKDFVPIWALMKKGGLRRKITKKALNEISGSNGKLQLQRGRKNDLRYGEYGHLKTGKTYQNGASSFVWILEQLQ